MPSCADPRVSCVWRWRSSFPQRLRAQLTEAAAVFDESPAEAKEGGWLVVPDADAA